ncbi:hypothetical protein EJ04DRAFT_572661 [Polyplosphaeria fusca]|uniref:Uncharacterized protein n=1 Tax=Polyplosphaeria fusca TaxID=682080 RepID=A0A9P4R6S2_9PLEO|nr:hypothetical protein EJ04DRAFT_572661 [Polyplosphaeria fusca]
MSFDLQAQDMLTRQIISQARIIYGRMNPNGHDFDVVVSKEQTSISRRWGRKPRPSFLYIARVVAYTKPGSFAEYHVLMCTYKGGDLVLLLENLRSVLQKLLDEKIVRGGESGYPTDVPEDGVRYEVPS